MSTTPRFRPPAVPPAALDEIRRRLVVRRQAAGLTARGLSAAAGLSESAVGLIESGRSDPSLGTLYALAAALDCHPADILRDAPGRPKKIPENPYPGY